MDVNGQRGLEPTSSVLSKSNKVDPYFLITQGGLNQLRIEVDKTIPKETPYSSNGAPEPWDEEELRKAFANAMVVRSGVEEYDHTRSPRRHASAPSFASHASNGAFGGTPTLGIHLASSTITGEQRYKLTKVGILNRKDDLAGGGTRVPSRSRKWRTWSVVLTGSSLLFFKNLNWYREIEEGGLLEEGGHALHGALQGADETIALNDAIAVIDATYTKVCSIRAQCVLSLANSLCSILPPFDWPSVLASSCLLVLAMMRIVTTGWPESTTPVPSAPQVFVCVTLCLRRTRSSLELWLPDRTYSKSSHLNYLQRRCTPGDHRCRRTAPTVFMPIHLLMTRSMGVV